MKKKYMVVKLGSQAKDGANFYKHKYFFDPNKFTGFGTYSGKNKLDAIHIIDNNSCYQIVVIEDLSGEGIGAKRCAINMLQNILGSSTDYFVVLDSNVGNVYLRSSSRHTFGSRESLLGEKMDDRDTKHARKATYGECIRQTIIDMNNMCRNKATKKSDLKDYKLSQKYGYIRDIPDFDMESQDTMCAMAGICKRNYGDNCSTGRLFPVYKFIIYRKKCIKSCLSEGINYKPLHERFGEDMYFNLNLIKNGYTIFKSSMYSLDDSRVSYELFDDLENSELRVNNNSLYENINNAILNDDITTSLYDMNDCFEPEPSHEYPYRISETKKLNFSNKKGSNYSTLIYIRSNIFILLVPEFACINGLKFKNVHYYDSISKKYKPITYENVEYPQWIIDAVNDYGSKNRLLFVCHTDIFDSWPTDNNFINLGGNELTKKYTNEYGKMIAFTKVYVEEVGSFIGGNKNIVTGANEVPVRLLNYLDYAQTILAYDQIMDNDELVFDKTSDDDSELVITDCKIMNGTKYHTNIYFLNNKKKLKGSELVDHIWEKYTRVKSNKNKFKLMIGKVNFFGTSNLIEYQIIDFNTDDPLKLSSKYGAWTYALIYLALTIIRDSILDKGATSMNESPLERSNMILENPNKYSKEIYDSISDNFYIEDIKIKNYIDKYLPYTFTHEL